MTNNYLSKLTAIEYRRFACADDTVRNRLDNGARLIFRDERELFCVGEIAQTSDLALVFDEVGLGDKWDGQSRYRGLDPVAPYLVEGHLADGGEDVDVVLRGAEAEIFFVVEKV
jgi:hypothetical protein